MSEDRPPRRHVKLGRLLGAAGLHGWLKVQSYTDPHDNLLRHKVWELSDGRGGRVAYELVEFKFDGRWIRARHRAEAAVPELRYLHR